MEQLNWSIIAHRIRLLFHLTATVHLGYAIYYDCLYAQLPPLAVELRLEPPIGGKFKYMTFLGALVHFGYYKLALAYDVLRIRCLRQLRDFIMASLVVPLATTVSLTFWTLYAIDREAIYPSVLDLVYPDWLNHTMHTFVMFYALLELMVIRHRYPLRRRGFACLGGFMAVYLMWMHFVWLKTGIWVYPFLGVLPWLLRLIFFVLIVGLGFVYYVIGERLNSKLWVSPSALNPCKVPKVLTRKSFNCSA